MAKYKVVDADRLDSDLRIVCDAIREKTGGTDLLEFPQEMKQAILDIPTGGGSEEDYNQGFTDGKQAEWSAFWDEFQQNGTLQNYNYAFYHTRWTEEIFKPKYNIKPTQVRSMFSYSNIEDLGKCLDNAGVVLDVSGCNAFEAMFDYASKLKKACPFDARRATSMNYFVRGCSALEELEINNILPSCTFSNSFVACASLKQFTVTGSIGKNISFPNSVLLTSESIQSIIDHLADLTGQDAQTVTFHSAVPVTSSQREQTLLKNWNIVGGYTEDEI